jgi:hypothetical protein
MDTVYFSQRGDASSLGCGEPMQRAALPAGAPEPDVGWLAEAEEFLPSPLAGEGPGERGLSAKTPVLPPLPNPSPARGEGLKTLYRGELPGWGSGPESSSA